jgi:4-hydroxybenzoate polyprenyltransferase
VSTPILLSILPPIILSSFPDRGADMLAGKRTLAVAFGIRRASQIAIAATLLTCASSALLWKAIALPPETYRIAILGCALHGLYLVRRIIGVPRTQSCRIDGTLLVALAFIAWPLLIPLVTL